MACYPAVRTWPITSKCFTDLVLSPFPGPVIYGQSLSSNFVARCFLNLLGCVFFTGYIKVIRFLYCYLAFWTHFLNSITSIFSFVLLLVVVVIRMYCFWNLLLESLIWKITAFVNNYALFWMNNANIQFQMQDLVRKLLLQYTGTV